MSLEGDWQIEYIFAVRDSITHTSDIDKLARETLKTYKRVRSPSDVPKGRLRKYFKNLLGEPCVYLDASHQGKSDILGT